MLHSLLAPAPRAGALAADQPAPPYTPRQSLAVRFGAYLGTMIVCLTLGLMVVLALGPQVNRAWGAPVLEMALVIGSLLGYVAGERLVARRRPLYELTSRRLSGLAAGLGLGAASILVCAALIAVLGGLRVDGLGHPAAKLVLLTLIQAGLQAAVVEEIAFRGILLRYLEVVVGSWGALIGSAVVFGGLHAFNPHASLVATVVVVEAGWLFAALYLLTRNLWVTMGMHFGWNVMQAALGIAVSGTVQAGALRSHPSGPDLLSGGAFGLEASLVTAVVLGAGALALTVLAHRRGALVAPLWMRRRHARQQTDIETAPARAV